MAIVRTGVCGLLVILATKSWAQPVARVAALAQDAVVADVSGMAMVGAGIVAADLQSGSLHFVSSSNRYVAFGRAGSGPGELSYPCCLTVMDDSTVAVREIGNRRYSLLRVTERGVRFLHTVRAPGNAAFEQAGLPAVNGQIRHLASSPQDRPRHRKFELYLLNAGREHSDAPVATPVESGPLPWLPIADVTRQIPGGQSTYTIQQPLGAQYLYAFDARGALISANASEGRVQWSGANGQPARTIVLPNTLKPVPLTKAERDSSEAFIQMWATRQNVERVQVPFGAPTHKPLLQQLGVDQDGRLWVQIHTASGQPNEAFVYGANGALLDRVRWPANVRLVGFAVAGTRGAGVQWDADGAPGLVRVDFSSAALVRK